MPPQVAALVQRHKAPWLAAAPAPANTRANRTKRGAVAIVIFELSEVCDTRPTRHDRTWRKEVDNQTLPFGPRRD